MTKDEILKYIQIGSTRAVCIDRCLLDQYPGYVREVIIMQDTILKVEFNQYGYDEGGLSIKVYYDEFDKLINAAQNYIGADIERWENINRTDWYPHFEKKVDYNESGLKLKYDLKNKTLSLPENGIKYQIPDGYWKKIADSIIDF